MTNYRLTSNIESQLPGITTQRLQHHHGEMRGVGLAQIALIQLVSWEIKLPIEYQVYDPIWLAVYDLAVYDGRNKNDQS